MTAIAVLRHTQAEAIMLGWEVLCIRNYGTVLPMNFIDYHPEDGMGECGFVSEVPYCLGTGEVVMKFTIHYPIKEGVENG